MVIVPASVHDEHAVTGGTFAIGQTRNSRVYRRDRFEQAAAIPGVTAARLRVEDVQ